MTLEKADGRLDIRPIEGSTTNGAGKFRDLAPLQ